MDEFGYASLLEEATAAVCESGNVILDSWYKPRKITLKGRIDLVTETDVAVEEDLKRRLHAILPEASFLAEESAGTAPLTDLAWIIDPVDGTTNFAHQIPLVASSVGLWHKGRMVLGIVNAPILRECFTAARGQGAALNGQPMYVTGTDNLEHALIATGFPYSIRDNVDEIMGWLSKALVTSRGVRRCGAAAVDFAFVAAGRYDAFYEIDLRPWDTSAGWLLVEEAGGKVTQLDTNAPFELYSRGVLATNGALHDTMFSLLKGQ
ncbi:inositol monophosphatase [Desulfovibrio mangrovi]|uniref:inositol monophosphatase family protein n=1 Tax=Desulfovibrio mangrovi TaxID=2976983 RepID=UPI0022475D14|nr:inositol monophosphatase family protein [Desulfovibrio mangrovi]UZP68308.1 inositol monophosphatase [Desulfovibrio mangrovi]